MSQDKEMRAEYEARMKEINDFNSAMTNAEAKGAKKEHEKANAEKRESAKIALSMGLSIDQVSKITGLSIDEVKKL